MVERPLYHLKALIPPKKLIVIFDPTAAWVMARVFETSSQIALCHDKNVAGFSTFVKTATDKSGVTP
jgi:hypothetical protein